MDNDGTGVTAEVCGQSRIGRFVEARGKDVEGVEEVGG